MTVTIAGKEYVRLVDAAKLAGINYTTLYMRVAIHPADFETERLGNVILVRMQDVLEYKNSRV